MARCRFEKSAHLYPFGMLSGREKSALEKHIGKCESCASAARDVKRIGLAYKTRPAAQPPPGFEQKIARSIKMKTPPARAGFDWLSFLGFNKAMFPIAAGLALVMAIAMFISLGNIFAGKTGGAGVVSSKQAAKTAAAARYAAGILDDSERALLADDGDAALGTYYKQLGNM